MTFTVMWLDRTVQDSAIELAGQSTYRADRTANLGKKICGGLFVHIHNSWCSITTAIEKHCSLDLEFLLLKCRAFDFPREFSALMSVLFTSLLMLILA